MTVRQTFAQSIAVTMAFIGLATNTALAAWDIQTVGTTNGSTGRNCSIALDAQGKPHIAYVRDLHDVCYANKTGATWAVTIIKTNGAPNGRISINVDTNGMPHICFGGRLPSPLDWGIFHAYITSGTNWTIERFDGAGTTEGWGLDSTFDATGSLHVSYYKSSAGIYYAVKSGGSWTISAVTNDGDATSIAVDALGQPHISYLSSGLWYATKTGATWSISQVDTNLARVGDTSICLDPAGRPHITWIDANVNRARYANWNGSSWTKEMISPAGHNVPWTEIAMQSSGVPVIAYANEVTDRLIFSDRASGAWQESIVEQDSGANCLDVIFLGLALDKSLNPHIAYFNNCWDNLKYAYRTGDRDGDGLADQDEAYIHGTDPDDADNDNDGLLDGAEVNQYGTDPIDADTDDDGLGDFYEAITKPCLDPLDADSDDDGVNDGQEVVNGTEPCVVTSAVSGVVSYVGIQTGAIRVVAISTATRTNRNLNLDGVDDGVRVSNATAALRLRTNHSFCAWLNLKAMPVGSHATILVKYDDTNQASYVASVDKASGKLRYSIGGSGNAFSTSTGFVNRGWTHVAFTHDGAVGRWYVNGLLDSTMTFASLQRFGDGDVLFGRAADIQSFFDRFNGDLDEVSLWSRTLNASEIQYVMSNSLAGIEAGLSGYWSFDDGTASDATTNSNAGVFLSGATTSVSSVTNRRYEATLLAPGAYSLTNIPQDGFDIWAYRDSTGNWSNDSWEAFGAYATNPLVVTGNMTGVDIIMNDPVTDTDGDGLTDHDEVYAHGSSWSNADTDADGMIDGEEVVAGSVPTNSQSLFKVYEGQPNPAGSGVVVTWPSLSNRVYRLDRSTNLFIGFSPLDTNIPPSPPMNSYTDGVPNDVGVYRVGVRME